MSGKLRLKFIQNLPTRIVKRMNGKTAVKSVRKSLLFNLNRPLSPAFPASY